jgi:hypothetical protein
MALAKVFDAESISKTTKTQDIFQLISQITSLIGEKHGLAAFFLRGETRRSKTTRPNGHHLIDERFHNAWGSLLADYPHRIGSLSGESPHPQSHA